MMVRAEEYTPTRSRRRRLLFEAGAHLPREARQRADRRASCSRASSTSIPSTSTRASRWPRSTSATRSGPSSSRSSTCSSRKVGSKKDNKELNQLYYRLARTADELGNGDKALKYYKLAYDLDSTFLPVLLGRAELLYKMEDWDGAFKIYQTILVHHRDSQKESEIVDIFYRLGNIKLKQGERKKALNMFEKALEIEADPPSDLAGGHRPAAAGSDDWEAVIHAKRQLLSIAEEPEKVKLLDEIGDIYHKQLQEPAEGDHRPTSRRSRSRPGNHVILQKVLDLYSETKQWKKAVEIIQRFAELEKDPIRKRQVLPRRRAHLARRGQVDSTRRSTSSTWRSISTSRRRRSSPMPDFARVPEGVRGDRQDLHRQEGLQDAGARLPQDVEAPAGGRATTPSRWRCGTRSVRSTVRASRSSTPRSRRSKWRRQLDPNNAAPARDPRRAVRDGGAGLLAEGRARAHDAHQARAVPRRQLQGAAEDLHGHAPVRQGVVHVLGAGVLAARRRRRDAVLRAVQAEGLRPGQGAPHRRDVGQEPVPPRGGPLHRRHLRGGVAGAWRCSKSGEHKQFGLKRKDKRELSTDQARVLEGVQLRHAGAQHLAAGGLLPARAAGRHAAREHAREGSAHPVARRRGRAAAGARRQGAGVPAGGAT